MTRSGEISNTRALDRNIFGEMSGNEPIATRPPYISPGQHVSEAIYLALLGYFVYFAFFTCQDEGVGGL